MNESSMQNSLAVMDFPSLAPVEVPVTIEGKKYTLREANGFAAKRYREACLGGMEMTQGEDGSRTTKRMQGVAGVESLLVSLCLYDDAGKNVPQGTIEEWPSRYVKEMFTRAKEISDLDEKEDADTLRRQAKNLENRIAKMAAEEATAKNS